MYRFLTLALSLAVFSVIAVAQPAGQKVDYDSLLAKLKDGDTRIDFKALRFAFAEKTSTLQRSPDSKIRVEMIKLYNEKKYKEALKIADEVLKSAYVDIGTHLIASVSHTNLGDEKKGKFHEQVYVGLINSILGSGDGNSTKTAYHVISVSEEYAVLQALELKRTTQSVLDEGGSKYDVLAVTDKNAVDAGRLYFNIDAVWKGYAPIKK